MPDLLLQMVLSNIVVSLALAAAAWAVHATRKAPVVAHLLWLLVLVKLVTPPFFTVAVVPVDDFSPAAIGLLPIGVSADTTDLDRVARDTETRAVSTGGAAPGAWKSALILLWLAGSIGVLGWSLAHVRRFNKHLGTASREAPLEVQRAAAAIAVPLEVKTAPTILATSARMQPMLWWLGGRLCIVIPESLIDGINAEQLRWVLAHELAHVKRRDHLVRWFEWLVCVLFWWNPVAWWARRCLRINEEICCDALVMANLKPRPRRSYAEALLAVVEHLAAPVVRPPAMASEVNSGGVLARRFKLIVSKNGITNTPRWLYACVLLATACLLPLGVASSQSSPDGDAVGQTYRRIGVSSETLDIVRIALAESELAENQIEPTLNGMTRVVQEMQIEGEAFELDPGLRSTFWEIGLSDQQLDLALRLARGLAKGIEERAGAEEHRGIDDAFSGIGVSAGDLGRIRAHLGEQGLSDQQIEPTLGGMHRLVYAMQTEGVNAQLDPRLEAYLTNDVGLTTNQVSVVVELARRIVSTTESQSHRDPGSDLGERRRLPGTGAEDVEPRFVPEEEYNRVRAELEMQVAAGEISREEATRKIADMQQENTMAHIEKSVEEGEMTRAEADALYQRLGYR